MTENQGFDTGYKLHDAGQVIICNLKHNPNEISNSNRRNGYHSIDNRKN